jgi:hypothetical protein
LSDDAVDDDCSNTRNGDGSGSGALTTANVAIAITTSNTSTFNGDVDGSFFFFGIVTGSSSLSTSSMQLKRPSSMSTNRSIGLLTTIGSVFKRRFTRETRNKDGMLDK